jgi:hypothetical protein
MLKERDIGCFQWGLVKGRSQTHLPWPVDLLRLLGESHQADSWFHDLLDENGRPYDVTETELIRSLTCS